VLEDECQIAIAVGFEKIGRDFMELFLLVSEGTLAIGEGSVGATQRENFQHYRGEGVGERGDILRVFEEIHQSAAGSHVVQPAVLFHS